MILFKKEGSPAKVGGIKPETILAIIVANQVLASMLQVECVVTSCVDSHDKGYHPDGYAVDLRTRHLEKPEDADRVASAIREALPDEYDVVVESDHIHIEYDVSK